MFLGEEHHEEEEVQEPVEVSDSEEDQVEFSQKKSRKRSTKRSRKGRGMKDGYKKYHAFNAQNKRIPGEFTNSGPGGAARKAANRETNAKGRLCRRVAVVQMSKGVNQGKRYIYSVHTKRVSPSAWAVRTGIAKKNEKILQTVVKSVRS